MAKIFFLDVPEYRPFIAAVGARDGIDRQQVGPYVRFSAPGRITIRRDETGLGEAVWFGALVAGFDGEVEKFDATELTVA